MLWLQEECAEAAKPFVPSAQALLRPQEECAEAAKPEVLWQQAVVLPQRVVCAGAAKPFVPFVQAPDCGWAAVACLNALPAEASLPGG